MPSPLEFLTLGELDIKGRMPWSSNATFLVETCLEGEVRRAVYKPRRGERPLWDFPDGLFKREVAAYELSLALGWDLVPLTVLRSDGPLDEGSLQWFVDADFEQHYFTLLEQDRGRERPRLTEAFQKMCVFDILANNTDRKSGHVLIDDDEHIWGIDNGLSFHHEFKLRTVIWEFGGDPIPESLIDDVDSLVRTGLPDPLAALLDPFERDAVLTRARAVVAEGTFPVDTTGRRYPWPLV